MKQVATPDPTAPGLAHQPRRGGTLVAIGVALGATVSLALGLVGSIQHTSYIAFVPPPFPSILAFKTWASTAVLVLAVAQLLTSTWMYGRVPLVKWQPRGLSTIHRCTGVIAFAICIPVAFYCLYDFGFQHDWDQPRIAAHSLAGCVSFGAFIIKITLVRARGMRAWVLPIAGGTVVALIVVLWSTSALWAFRTGVL